MTLLKTFIENRMKLRLIGKVPYSMKLGLSYVIWRRKIKDFEKLSPEIKKEIILKKLNKSLLHARNNIDFYKERFKNVSLPLNSLEEYELIPLMNKLDVRAFMLSLEDSKGRGYQVNTGGSTGVPLELLQDKKIWAREWAFMHSHWYKKGYRSDKLMLTLMGKNLGTDLSVYNPVHNEIKLNTYLNLREYKTRLEHMLLNENFYFVQAYPSTLWVFLKEIKSILKSEAYSRFVGSIRCVLLSSELTPIYYRNFFAREFVSAEIVTWYGHSEMCIYANEQGCPFVYESQHLYGYTEIVNGLLTGTSYNNSLMPLFRYNSGDKAAVVTEDDGLVKYFEMASGRLGDTIKDLAGKELSLTGLIYGRHHKIFNVARSVQVRQEEKGVLLIMVSLNTNIPLRNIPEFFDFSHANLKVSFQIIDNPVLTQSGKQLLRI